MRNSLIVLRGRAEGLLELEFATFLIKIPQPLNNLNLFPYYGNYVKLANLEYKILSENGVVQPKKLQVGMSKEEKVKIIGHIRKYMKEGGILLVRSADGARAFLYPVVEENDLVGLERVLSLHNTLQSSNYQNHQTTMASLQNSNFETQISAELLIARITQIHSSISKLDSLRPSKQVNTFFSHLVKLCILPSSIDIRSLSPEVQEMRNSLIVLCGRAEGLLELEFATFLIKMPQPLNNLNLFPYYGNYVKLANLEYKILSENGVMQPKKVAFVGSGPMPLTSLVMAAQHLKSTHFDNFDIDETANDVARQIVASDGDLEKRMKFETCNVMEVREKLGEYDCIFLAALVGMCKEESEDYWAYKKVYEGRRDFAGEKCRWSSSVSLPCC
ncbi:hypothetical protein GH714_002003 [Hevea brasiliensis]|uniref:Nicotianamine synthase n=1 Tax=Hevea brasiliensis TaxID=3981 RepID=A0A6A6MA66_HEVBR|nr:hypothetical protein GH714_002003 [Hevea brasiliensis]